VSVTTEDPLPPRGRSVDYAYKAFISYSHAADGKLAPELQSGLHRFAKPWYKLRSMRVFRDATSMSNTPELWPTIEAALQKSEYFVLLASPEAAQSPWVRKEVEYWVANRSKDTFLIVLTNGELVWDDAASAFDWTRTNALPKDIDYPLSAEPRFTDLRDVKSETQLSERHPGFRDGVADIASTLLGKSKDELIGEDLRRHQQTKRITWSVASALVVLTVSSVFAAYTAVQNQQIAELRQRIAESRQLAVEARRQLDANKLDVALLLGVQAVKTYESLEARRVLLEAIKREPNLRSMAHPEIGFSASSSGIAFSPDGSVLATTGNRYSVVLWDVATKRVKSHLSAPVVASRLQTLEFSPAGHVIAGAGDHGVSFWDAASGELLPDSSLDIRRVRSIAFDPKASRIATAGCGVYERGQCRSASLQLWDLSDMTPVGPALVGHSDFAQAVAFSSNGTLVATGAVDGTVAVWDATALGNPLSTFDAGVGAVCKLVFDKDNHLSAVNIDGVYSRWNPRTGRKISDPSSVGLLTFNSIEHLSNFPFAEPVLTDNLRASLWAAHDNLLATVSGGAVMFVNRYEREFPSRKAKPTRYTASLDGAKLSVRRDGQLRWEKELDVASARHLTSRVAFSRDFTHVAVAGCSESQSEDERDPTDRYWKAACVRSHVVVFDVESQERIAGPFRDHAVAVLAITLSRDGQALVSVGRDGTRSMRNLVTSEASIVEAPGKGLELRIFAFDADERRLVASEATFGGDASRILLWDRIHDPETDPRQWQRNSAVSAIAFNPKNNSLAIGGHGGDITLWDPQSQQPQSSLSTRFADSGTHEVKALAFNRAGDLLATITTGGGLAVWDLPSRQSLIRDSSSSALPLYFDPDADEFAAGSKRIDVSLVSWIETACNIAARNLTWTEWALYVPNKAYETTCVDRHSPSDLIEYAQYLAEVGEESATPVIEATSLARGLGAVVNEKICEVGGFLGHGSVVLQACDRTIELCELEFDCDRLKGKRAVARAMAGDLSGAADDLELATKRIRIERADSLASQVDARERWIDELRAGRNPFDDATRYELRYFAD
jgi:WD40 repeat protein